MTQCEFPFSISPLIKQWLDFHAKHPDVYQLVEQFGIQAGKSGRVRFGIRLIWERVRWHIQVETEDEPYKLPNNHTPFYARLFLHRHPEFEHLFQTCESVADYIDYNKVK